MKAMSEKCPDLSLPDDIKDAVDPDEAIGLEAAKRVFKGGKESGNDVGSSNRERLDFGNNNISLLQCTWSTGG